MRSFEERLKEIWKGEQTTGVSGALAVALRLLSLPYGGIIAARNRLYDRGLLKQDKLPRPVISVGNLSVGGTGKTPTVIFIAHILKERGYRPAVLSRGYGGSAHAPVNVVSDGNSIRMGWREAGDEPILIARALPGIPVLTGSRRLFTGRAAVETFGADVLILDDGFQHRSLFRDIDMVLLDDNFATIVAAVEEGRKIYDNIRKFIKYLLSCNASEIAVMLLAPLIGMPLPLLPLQILWMNLVTDGLPALALGVEPAEENIMTRPPYSSKESIFGRGLVVFIGVMGIAMSLFSLGIGAWAFRSGDPAWQTLLFTTLVFSQVILALEVRSERTSIFRIGLFTNPLMVVAFLSTVGLQVAVVYLPFMQKIFSTAPLGAGDLLIAFGSGMAVLIVVETWKWILRLKAGAPLDGEAASMPR